MNGEKNLLQIFADKLEDKCLASLLNGKASFDLFKTLDTELFIHQGSKSKGLLVTSAGQGEGRTSVAVMMSALAATLDVRKKVLLVNGHFSGSSLSQHLGLTPHDVGLHDYFICNKKLEEIIIPTSIPNLQVVDCGKTSGLPLRFNPQRFKDFFNEASQEYDLLVADSPPISNDRDALSLAAILERVVMVVKHQSLPREQIMLSIKELERIGASMMGVIMNQRTFPIPKIFYGNH